LKALVILGLGMLMLPQHPQKKEETLSISPTPDVTPQGDTHSVCWRGEIEPITLVWYCKCKDRRGGFSACLT